MHFLHTLSAPVLISTLVSVCLSSPLAQSQAPFAVKEPAHGGRRYENGELPPSENTAGWIDPRLNGGRFLDVRVSR